MIIFMGNRKHTDPDVRNYRTRLLSYIITRAGSLLCETKTIASPFPSFDTNNVQLQALLNATACTLVFMRNPALRVRHMYPLQTEYNRQPLRHVNGFPAPGSQTTMS